jgi:hypothetical protein
MKPRIDLRFRPGLLIFVGDAGRHIRDQLQTIVRVAGLDYVLHQSIALLHVETGSDRAVPCPLGDDFVDEDAPREEDDLKVLIERTLKDVQANQRILEIISAGYPVPNPRTQIYIIGEASSHWLAHILQTVNRRLEKNQFSTTVCYILSAYHDKQKTGALSERKGGLDQMLEATHDKSYWSEREVANFCYLYEDMLTYPVPTFVREFESYHAAAEALFALTATGLTTEPLFEEIVRLNPNWNIYENVGSLSTSLISFPRQALLEYCSARLGVALTVQWLHDIRGNTIADARRKKMQETANRTARCIEAWIKDDPERPLANTSERRSAEWKTVVNTRRWPNLNMLRRSSLLDEELFHSILDAGESLPLPNNQIHIRRRLDEESEALFELFWPEEVAREYRNLPRRTIQTWTKLVYEQAGNAVEAYKEWDRAASEAWDTASCHIRAEIKYIIDQLWSDDSAGFEMATIFIDELDDQMSKVASRLSRWREAHERDYARYLQYIEQVADGPWVIPDDQPSIIGGPGVGTAQASPTMDNRPASTVNTASADSTETSGATNGAILGAPMPSVTPLQHLPEREERIARLLELRVQWLQEQIPPLPTQITVALPFIVALTFTALAFVPNSFLTDMVAACLSTALVSSVHLSFRSIHQKKIAQAKSDLLTFYRRYYAYRCEKREDRLRTVLMGPLRRNIQAIREKLDDIYSFIQEIQKGLEAQAVRIHRDLFNSPASARDIFIANGERLQKERKNTLEDFVGQVTKLRVKEPVEVWHQSSHDIKKQLIRQFRGQPESILEMSEAQAQRQIYEFAEQVIKPYFKGPLVDLHQALSKQDIWREALERAKNPLYRAQVGLRDPQFLFVCGREADISQGLPYLGTSVYPVHISHHHEWILVAALFRGGLPAALDTDQLFPFRVTPSEPPAPDDGGDGTAQTIDDPDDQPDAVPIFDAEYDQDEIYDTPLSRNNRIYDLDLSDSDF